MLPIFSFSVEASANEIYECQVYIALNVFNPITILGDENSDFCSVVMSFNGLKFKESFPIIEGDGRNFPEAFENMLIRFKETQVSMEKTMACSIGVCRGCVIEINKNGEKINKTVCKDGPVFWGNEVIWQI